MSQILYLGTDEAATQKSLDGSGLLIVPYAERDISPLPVKDFFAAAVVQLDYMDKIPEIRQALPSVPVLLTWYLGYGETGGADKVLNWQETSQLAKTLKELVEQKP